MLLLSGLPSPSWVAEASRLERSLICGVPATFRRNGFAGGLSACSDLSVFCSSYCQFWGWKGYVLGRFFFEFRGSRFFHVEERWCGVCLLRLFAAFARLGHFPTCGFHAQDQGSPSLSSFWTQPTAESNWDYQTLQTISQTHMLLSQ